MFILVSNPLSAYPNVKEYYLGKTYRVQSKDYPCSSEEQELAKEYKSQKVANNVCKKLNTKLEHQEFRVEKI